MSFKKRFLNKKGQTEEGFNAGFFLIAGFIFIVMVFVLLLVTGQYKEGFLAVDKDVPTHVYAYRSINTCLAYQDEITGRYYPGLIDYTKYRQEVLETCYSDTSARSFNIQLKDLDKPRHYDRILVGFGGSMNIKSYPVLIRYKNGDINNGELLFGISRY